MKAITLVSALLPAVALAQRPAATSICDYYSAALFNSTSAASEYALLTALVNRAVIGNSTATAADVSVAGILAPGTVNGTSVNLLPYFNGCLASTNRGNQSVSVNFLDDGGADPLQRGLPSNTQTSNQYRLLTHLYQFFGRLLGCSAYDSTGFPAYQGRASQYQVHRFMSLSSEEIIYFTQQVGLSALSFGVSEDDVDIVGNALLNTFGYRCSPPSNVGVSAGPVYNSICTDASCPIDPVGNCTLYPENGISPIPQNTCLIADPGDDECDEEYDDDDDDEECPENNVPTNPTNPTNPGRPGGSNPGSSGPVNGNPSGGNGWQDYNPPSQPGPVPQPPTNAGPGNQPQHPGSGGWSDYHPPQNPGQQPPVVNPVPNPNPNPNPYPPNHGWNNWGNVPYPEPQPTRTLTQTITVTTGGTTVERTTTVTLIDEPTNTATTTSQPTLTDDATLTQTFTETSTIETTVCSDLTSCTSIFTTIEVTVTTTDIIDLPEPTSTADATLTDDATLTFTETSTVETTVCADSTSCTSTFTTFEVTITTTDIIDLPEPTTTSDATLTDDATLTFTETSTIETTVCADATSCTSTFTTIEVTITTTDVIDLPEPTTTDPALTVDPVATTLFSTGTDGVLTPISTIIASSDSPLPGDSTTVPDTIDPTATETTVTSIAVITGTTDLSAAPTSDNTAPVDSTTATGTDIPTTTETQTQIIIPTETVFSSSTDSAAPAVTERRRMVGRYERLHL